MIRSNVARKTLFPKHVFRISRGTRPRVDNIFFVLEQDGVQGFGEASPSTFYREDPSDISLALLALTDYFKRQTLTSVEDIARMWNDVWERVAPSRACLCAVDLALWDLLGKLQGKTVCETVLGRAAKPVATSATLGLCPKEEWPERIEELSGFSSVKVKMDASADLELLRAIRSQSSAVIRVDANGAWAGLDIASLSEQLERLGVEFIEQPLMPVDDDRMPNILRASRLPILADESCALPSDVARLVGRFSGFNIKLVKCGGITPALEMLGLGKKLGLKIMIGCMLESSLLIAAGAVLAQEADYADLDGSWLLRNDPFDGLRIDQGKIILDDEPGLGVKPKFPRETP